MSFMKDKQDQKGSIDKEKKITKRTSRRHESKLLAFSVAKPSNEEGNDDSGELSISPNTTLDQNTYEYPLRQLVISSSYLANYLGSVGWYFDSTCTCSKR